ncbi:MAG TPA: hypothetical protein VIZ90_18600 [Rhizobiaceae bacterium]
MRIRFAVGGALLGVFFAGSANAQWIYQGNESAFGDNVMHIAVTGVGNYGFGFRCKGGDVEAIYITPDRSFSSDAAYTMANATRPKLRVRVDDQAIVDLEAQISDADGTASIIAAANKELLVATRDARKRVAVVLELLGENYHEQSFNVRGSTKSINSVIAGCGLSEG